MNPESSPWTSKAMTWLFRLIGLGALVALALVVAAPIWFEKKSTQDSASTSKLDTSSGDSSSDSLEQIASIDGVGLPIDIDNDDREESRSESPLFGGVSRLMGQLVDATGSEDLDLSDALSAADQEFARTKRQNRIAMNEANRRFRRVGVSDKHIVLITVEGLTNEDLEHIEPFKILDKLRLVSLRFTQFYSPTDPIVAWHSFHESTNDVTARRAQASYVRLIRDAGYQTALFGDCTHAPIYQGEGDRSYDFRFGIESFADRDDEQIDSIWSNGVEMKLADTRHQSLDAVQDLCVREAAEFIKRENRGRPFFLHLALRKNGTSSIVDHDQRFSEAMTRLNDRVESTLRALHDADVERESIVILAGMGGDPSFASYGTAAVDVPLMYYWPRKSAGGKSVQLPSGSLDLLPTIADWADSKRSIDTVAESLAPSALEELQTNQRTLVWKHPGLATVVCRNPWKLTLSNSPLLEHIVTEDTKYVQIGGPDWRDREPNNMASQYPDVVQQLTKVVEQE